MQIAPLPANEAERLAALARLEILDTPADAAFDELTGLAAELFDVPIALVSLIDRARQWFKSRHGLCVSETARDAALCSHVVHAGEMLVVEDALADARFADNPLVVGEPRLRFYAGAPVRSDEGYVLGTLCVIDRRPRRFDERSRTRLRQLASQVEHLIRLHRRTAQLDAAARRTLASNARYHAIIGGAAAGIVRIDGRGRMLELNRYALEMLGYHADELVGRNVSMLMPEQWAQAHDGYLEAYIRSGEARVIGKGREVEALHRDGYTIPVQLAVSEVARAGPPDNVQSPDGGDAETREFIGILTDLRDIRTVRERQAREHALLAVLHRGLTDYHALLSQNTLWTFLKEALRELTGSRYALIGEVVTSEGQPALKIHAITDLSWSDETRALMKQLSSGDMMLTNPDSMLGRVFARGETVLSNDMEQDARGGRLPPGHPPLHRYLGVPIVDRGEVIGMYAIANADASYDQALVEWLAPFTSTCALLINLYRQLDAQRRFTEELRIARDRAERASQAKTEFLSSMSHELRTPLNAILGFAQLLQNGRQPLSERQARHTDHIVRSGRHLLSLINEVLDLARIESGHMQVSLEPIDLAEVLEETVETVRPLAAQQHVALHLPAVPACACAVQADYTRLRQVLINLLSNAIKYNRPQGAVWLGCEVRGTRLRLSVRDTGVGIAADKLDQLFQPFNRLGAEAGGVEGTGVGLALTRKLVHLMQGEIGVESVAGEGSVFWIELPLQHGLPAGRAKASPPASLADSAAPRRVLCIEDNPANLRLMEDVFAELGGIALACADSAEQGIELACSEPPELILMDIDLPGMDGFAAQRILARNPLTAHVPVLAISARAAPGDIRRARAAGFVDYLTKPLDLAALLDRLRQILESKVQDADPA